MINPSAISEENFLRDIMNSTPDRLSEIIEEFQRCDGREKLELLLYYAEKMPTLPEWLQEQHNEMHKVHECMTPVFIYAETEDSKMRFYFDVPRESPTVRGYASLLMEGFEGTTAEQVLQVPTDFYLQLRLHEVLSNQRLIGIGAILANMKRLALEFIAE